MNAPRGSCRAGFRLAQAATTARRGEKLTTTAPAAEALGPSLRPSRIEPGPGPALPVKVWAGVGAVVLAIELYLVIKWVSGPYFTRVSSGPSVPPTWMKVAIITAQVLTPALVLVFLYAFVVRPWRRERRVIADGLLCLALVTVSVLDPLSDYLQNWFTYNSYFVNFGSLVKGIPGWVSYGAPGKMVAFPIIFMPAVYGGLLLAGAIGGCWVMTRLRSRWPGMSNMTLVVAAYLIFVTFDLVMEAVVFMPLGFYVETGFSVDSGHFYQMPISNVVLGAATWLAIACVRYFRNDKGYMLCERGAEKIDSRARREIFRFLGTLAAIFTVFVLCYQVPQMLWQGAHPGSWSVDERYSYFTNHLCGPGTDRACPGPGVPASSSNTPYLDPSGKLVVPPSVQLPTPLTFVGCPSPRGSASRFAPGCP